MKLRSTSRFARVTVAVGGVLMMSSLLSGCFVTSLGPISGTAPLRYRDVVFPNVTISSDIQYGSAPDLNTQQPVALKLDLYQPTGDKTAARPAVVYAHSGGFSGGDKAGEANLFEPLVQRGFVVASINYRLLTTGCTGADLTPECTVGAQAGINDGQAAVRWLRANAATYRIDTNRIAFEGFSAGAIIATGVGLTWATPGTSGNPGYSSKVSSWVSISGGFPGGELVGPGDPAGYLFSGTADTTVPYQWSVDTARALDQTGALAVLYTEQGMGHVPPDTAVLTQQATSFYWLTMDLAHAAT